ncbi:MAG: hypothetical protein COA79_10070 [Planctomycetota bacterium]|nr:MAG: hypothetical protein COA79_10070 [Planctomycetota bacterium]
MMAQPAVVAILQSKKPSQADYYVMFIYIVFLLYFLVSSFDIISFKICMFRNLTGIECPTCGFTRAATDIAYFRFLSALHQNPLVFLILPAIGYHWTNTMLILSWHKRLDVSKYFPTKSYIGTVLLVGLWAFINNNIA